MSYILSSTTINYAYVDDLLKISLEEPPNNYQWELILPDSFQIIKGSYSPTSTSLFRTWTIAPTISGNFTVYCHYRKLCCGKPIVKTVSYSIVIF